MATEFAKADGIFSMDTPGGALTEYHDGLMSINWKGARDNSQSGSLGTNNIKKAYTGKDALTGEMKVKKDLTTNSLYQDLWTWMYDSTYRGDSFTVRFEAPDGEIGSDQHDLEIKLTSFDDDGGDESSGDAAMVTVGFAVDGSYTKTVIT